MQNIEIARIFHEIADLLEIKGENPFRVRSYRNAALAIEGISESIERMIERDEKEIETIPGIGKSIHEKIVEIVKKGTCKFHTELFKELPEGLLDLLQLQGVGPKKVQLLYQALGIKSIDDLEKAAKAHKLYDLPGMGEKTEEKILKAIRDVKSREGRFRLYLAILYSNPLIDYLKETKGIIDISLAGSLRRWKDTIGDVDILVTCRDSSIVMKRFINYPEVRDTLAVGDTKSSVVLRNGLQVDLRVLERNAFGAALQYFTGSKAHNIAIRDRAKRMGLKVSESGVFREDNNERVAGEKEEDVYKVLGLPWIPPELRENRGEIEAALDGRLPRLVELKDIKGDLHVHTKATDGGYSIEEMAEAAMTRGYEYIAITDHSRAIGIAHGMDEKRLLKQMDEIDKINAGLKAQSSKFRVLKGVEVDIKADRSLDLDEKVLSELDVVVGAVHSRFNMEADEMTERIISAMATGVVDIIAHPTGRIIGMREPYPVDMKRLMEAAKRFNVIMELNSYPDRLDLSDIHLRLAKDIGVMVVISTDSHSKLHYDNIVFGIHTARRGWLEKEDILNTRPVKEVLRLLKRQ